MRLVDPQRREDTLRGVELDAREAVRVALEVREAVIQLRRADRLGQPGSRAPPRRLDSVPTGIPRSSERSTVRPGTRSTTRPPSPCDLQVGMSPAAVRTRIGADVRRRRAHAQPLLRERVLDRESERERIPGLRTEVCSSTTRCGSRSATLQAAHRTRPWIAFAVVRLGEGELVTPSVELVAPVLEPVRPRDQHLAPPDERISSRPVPVEDVAARRPSTNGARRRPRRRLRAGRRARSRTARRTERSLLVRSSCGVERRRARPAAGDDEGPHALRDGRHIRRPPRSSATRRPRPEEGRRRTLPARSPTGRRRSLLRRELPRTP